MCRAIVITSGKGGVGKTTASSNIAAALAIRGAKVVAIDADIGLRNLDVALGLETRIKYNIIDVVQKRCRLPQALIADKRFPGLFLLAASQAQEKSSSLTPYHMRQLVSELSQSYEFIIIDCPAGIEQGFQNAIAGAKEAIIVTTPEISAVRDADRVITLMKSSTTLKLNLIVNKVRFDMVKRGEMMSTDDILDILPVSLLGVIPDEKDIVIASNKGEPIVSMEDSKTSMAYHNIAARLLGENVPFLDIERKQSIFKRFAEMLHA